MKGRIECWYWDLKCWYWRRGGVGFRWVCWAGGTTPQSPTVTVRAFTFRGAYRAAQRCWNRKAVAVEPLRKTRKRLPAHPGDPRVVWPTVDAERCA
jgi:hypothetical protein